jgi:hypothetical protein
MSLARATDDPLLKERYEDLAVDLARNAERERTLEISNRLEASATQIRLGTDVVDLPRCQVLRRVYTAMPMTKKS